MIFSRPSVLRIVPAAALAFGFTLVSGLALGPARADAAAPLAQTQAPGFYRVMVGDFEVTALSDGTVQLPVDTLLTHTTAAEVNRALARNFQSAPLETSVNAYLVNTGAKLVLIDTGAAKLFGPTLGRLIDHLKASGYTPEQVDEIYITHMHPDHVGGLMNDAGRAFPNAVVRADRQDADFWLNPAAMDKAPADAKASFQGAMASVEPYRQAGRFSAFDASHGDTELTPGIRAHAGHGHTPGHTVYLLESRGQKMAVWGDLVHVAAVQFEQPTVTIKFDTDATQAAAQRQLAYADAARAGYLVAAAHLPFPGIGHIRKQGAGYEYLPVSYAVIR